MGHRAPRSPVYAGETQPAPLPLADLERAAHSWLLDGQIRRLSPRTLEARADLTKKLLWWLRQEECPTCGTPEVRGFLAYVNTGHLAPGGRWGNPRMTRPVSARTTKTYYITLHALFGWLVEEGILPASPLAALRPPIARSDQPQPFTPEQLDALLAAAKASWAPRRNEAILLLLLDTGMRVSELCGLRGRHLDLLGRRCVVTGKGDKDRTLYFGRRTGRALWAHLGTSGVSSEAALFVAGRGPGAHQPMTRSGVRHLFEELGKTAQVEAVRCSPHTMRHTFAIMALRNGMDVFTLQQLLGHESLDMCRRYLHLAEADLETQHRQFSPVDRLKRRGM